MNLIIAIYIFFIATILIIEDIHYFLYNFYTI